MAVINIGKKYKEAFDSVCKLCQSGFGPQDDPKIRIVEDGTRREIVVGANTFRYDDGESRERSINENLSYTSDGANWFSALRGEEGINDGMADWIALIERVASNYHKTYSFIEYKQDGKRNNRSLHDVEQGKILIDMVVAELFPHLHAGMTIIDSSQDDAENIYGATLRVELSGGTGVAIPVLAKVFFRQSGYNLIPIGREEGLEIEKSIRSAIPEKNAKIEESKTDTGSIDMVLTAMDKLLYGNTGMNFGDTMCFSEKDEGIVNGILRQISRDNLKLECSSVRTLGISHVRWNNSALKVAYGDSIIFRAVVGINGAITLYCMNCKETRHVNNVLLDKSRFSFYITDENNEERLIEGVVKPKKNLGLDKETLDILRAKFSEHLNNPCKDTVVREGRCTRLVCKNGMKNMGSEEAPIWRCTDCPYPEVVFYDGGSDKYSTPTLAFARDKLTLIPKEETATCTVCGRTFSRECVNENNRCKFCSAGSSPEEVEKAKHTYRKYAGVFSTFARIASIGKEKLCFESEDILMFSIGGKKYVFDKVDLLKKGYLKPPVDINGKGGRR